MSERFTVRLDEDAAEWVEAEADARDRSKAWIIQQAIAGARGTDSVFTDAERTGSHQSAPMRTDAHLTDRVETLEARVAALEDDQDDQPAPGVADDGAPSRAERAGDDEPTRASAEATNAVTGQPAPRETDTLDATVRAQLPKDCPEADAEAVAAIAAYLRDEPEQWASPQEIRDALHEEYPAGKENPEYWWKRMGEWLEHVDEVDHVHQRRVEWAGAADSGGSGVYDPTEEF